jgi:hypothetical protein
MRFQWYLTQGRIDTRFMDALRSLARKIRLQFLSPAPFRKFTSSFVRLLDARSPSGWLVGPAGLQTCSVFGNFPH